MARRDADYWRVRGKVIYRALRDDFGAKGATADDLMPLIGATDRSGVFMALNWLREQGVRIVCARDRRWSPPADAEERASRTVPHPSRWALRESLPEAWDAMLPADGSEVEVMESTVLSEVTGPTRATPFTPEDVADA